MSAMRKIGEYLGLLEDTGVYDDEEYDEEGYAGHEAPEPARASQPRAASQPGPGQPAPVANLADRRRARRP